MASCFRIIVYYCLLLVNVTSTTSPECLEKLVTIYIDAANGNDSSCLPRGLPPQESEHPCQSLDYALGYRINCVSYIILSTSITLTSVAPFSNLHGLTFSGSSYSEVICSSDEVGLAFFNVSNLTFENISFAYCGTTRNSTSKSFESEESLGLLEFRAALYMERCEGVMMSSVNVSCSKNATGVVMYSTGGVNIIENCIFSSNTVPEGYPGGGGFYLEFSYCIPGDSGCVNGMKYVDVSHANYSFENSHFSDNIASSSKNKSHDVYIIPFESSHHAFGRGGGLSVFIKGSSAYNVISVTNCTFSNNTAEWGGGSFVEFHDNTGSNEILFTNCTFQNNSCKYQLTQGTGGGGLRIGHYVYGINDTMNYDHGNRIEVIDCHFLCNHAMYGGGISISPTLQNISNYTWGREGSVEVKNCTFRNNSAMMGAAININKFALFSVGIMLRMVLSDLTVDSNSAFYADLINKSNTPHTEGVGALYVHQVYTTFKGRNTFTNNTHSGIAIVGTTVDFTNSNNTFLNNSGYRGGGISLLGSAYLLISDNTWMLFDSNEVRNEGGAIYNRYVEMDNIKTRSNCFVRHSDPFRSPNEWGATFIFKNNSDHRHQRNNSIHTSSILPCSWAGGSGISTDLDTILCWNNWTYFDECNQICDCKSQISSDAGNITFNNVTKGNDDVHVNATPGWDFILPLSIKDDYNHDVNNNIVFLLMRDQGNMSTSYIWGNKANLRGTENSSVNISLESVGDRIWEVNVVVDLQSCPLGFILDDDSSCTCPDTYGGLVTCDSGAKTITFTDNDIWLGKTNGRNDSFIGLCPPGFCNTSILIHADNISESETLFCSHNRTGVMCGHCIDNYGPAVNSRNFDCINCTGNHLASNLSKYIASIYVPLTFLFLILIVFDVRLTTGPANAFILYCQAVTSTFGLGVGQVPLNQKITRVEFLDTIYQFVYGISNLEFIENLAHRWCLSPYFSTLTVLSLDYGVAIFPLIMIFTALLILKLKECPCRCSFKICRTLSRVGRELFRWRKSTIGEALLPAFAAFILLSYNKFGLTSSYILAVQPLIAANGSSFYPSRIYFAGQYTTNSLRYVRYFIPSVIAFGFTCIIPIMLLTYPLKFLEWCLQRISPLWRYYPVDKIHFFLDTFQGCYKTNMRFFAGLYFLFRLVINSAYLATTTWLEQFLIQQVACVIMVALLAFCRPYSKENGFLNYVDILIFSDLLLINVLSLYLYIAIINGQHPSSLAPVIQYILVFLPLVYMVGYIFYFVLRKLPCFKQYVNSVRREGRIGVPSRATISQIFTTEPPSSEDDDYEDDLLQRAENTNKYRKVVDNHAVNDRNSERNANSGNSERTSNRPSGSLNRLTNVSQSNGSSQHGASLGYGTCGTTSSNVSSVKM